MVPGLIPGPPGRTGLWAVAGTYYPVFDRGAAWMAVPEKIIRWEIKFFPGFVLVYLLPGRPFSHIIHGSVANVDFLRS